MSIQSAKAFLELVQKDTGLHSRLARCRDSMELMDIAREKGYDFTPDEARMVMEQPCDGVHDRMLEMLVQSLYARSQGHGKKVDSHAVPA